MIQISLIATSFRMGASYAFTLFCLSEGSCMTSAIWYWPNGINSVPEPLRENDLEIRRINQSWAIQRAQEFHREVAYVFVAAF